jgi:hypothetical protein
MKQPCPGSVPTLTALIHHTNDLQPKSWKEKLIKKENKNGINSVLIDNSLVLSATALAKMIRHHGPHGINEPFKVVYKKSNRMNQIYAHGPP